MNQIISRTLHRRNGVEGPQHDPYSVTTRIVEVNGDTISLRAGIGLHLSVNGQEVMASTWRVTEAEVYARFQALTGMDPWQFDRYYDRVHPYYPDPYGPLSRYE